MSDVVQLEGEGASIALSGDGSTIQLILREGGGGGAVDSVNGQTGTVSLDLDDLTDVDTTTDPPDADDVLAWDGVTWTPATLTALGAPGLSNATPADLGTAAPGVSTEASRADHVHDLPTAADVGAAASLHVHSGADITSGTVATARLGTGAANATTFLRGDGTWAGSVEAITVLGSAWSNAMAFASSGLGGTLGVSMNDSATSETWAQLGYLPWAAVDIYALWGNINASNVGNVWLSCRSYDLRTADNHASAQTTDVAYAPAGVLVTGTYTSTVIERSKVISNWTTPGAGNLTAMSVRRIGGHASDTLVGTIRFYGVEIRKAGT